MWLRPMPNDVDNPAGRIQWLMYGQGYRIVVGMYGAVPSRAPLLFVRLDVRVFGRHLGDGGGLGATTETEHRTGYRLPLKVTNR
jgi:hypothetical protein